MSVNEKTDISNSNQELSNQTHFGFKQVDKSQKASMVAEVFQSVAAKYDIMNDVNNKRHLTKM